MKAIDSFRGKYRFLSNFYRHRIVYLGVAYPTNEHAYQAMKSLFIDVRRRISKLPTPGDAKRMGKRLRLRSDWEEVKETVMKDLLRKKFFEDDFLAAELLKTGDAELIEGNTWGDTYWGVCKGVGKNRLGVLLMEVREELRKFMKSNVGRKP